MKRFQICQRREHAARQRASQHAGPQVQRHERREQQQLARNRARKAGAAQVDSHNSRGRTLKCRADVGARGRRRESTTPEGVGRVAANLVVERLQGCPLRHGQHLRVHKRSQRKKREAEPHLSQQVKVDSFQMASSSSSTTDLMLDVYRDSTVGVELAFPRSWHKWSSSEFESQGGVACFTPESETTEQPTVSFNLMVYPDGTRGARVDQITRLSSPPPLQQPTAWTWRSTRSSAWRSCR
jgi:hypothetical protein